MEKLTNYIEAVNATLASAETQEEVSFANLIINMMPCSDKALDAAFNKAAFDSEIRESFMNKVDWMVSTHPSRSTTVVNETSYNPYSVLTNAPQGTQKCPKDQWGRCLN